MKRHLISSALLALSLVAGAKTAVNEGPFGWASAVSLTAGDVYEVTGGDESSTVILRSSGFDMREELMKALKDYDVVVLDGSAGDFVISSFMKFQGLSGKTLMGINGAKLRTAFSVTDELRKLLDDTGVRAMSDQGGGGKLSNGAYVAEEREQHTRQAIIDYTGDASENYRRAEHQSPHKPSASLEETVYGDDYFFHFYFLIAAMPGSSMPSRYSSMAPPPVET